MKNDHFTSFYNEDKLMQQKEYTNNWINYSRMFKDK